MKKTIIPLALSAAFPWLATPAHATDEQAALPAVSITATRDTGLNAPVATGSNLDVTSFQTPASASTITREQLEQRGDASVVDAITRSTGISSLAHPGNGGSSLAARGFTDSTSVMRLYDGTRQYGGVGVTFSTPGRSIASRFFVGRHPSSTATAPSAAWST